MNPIRYRLIDPSQAGEIARLAVCLTQEIIERTGIRHFDVDVPLAEALCDDFVRQGHYHVVAACDGAKIVGFGALCESRSLYAEGVFGIIQEFYVLPGYRSQQVGADLLRELKAFARARNWKRLELCTPPVPEFERTVAFYRANGFDITGGYKMKCVLDA